MNKITRREFLRGSASLLALQCIPAVAKAGESTWQTTYGSKQFDNVTITVELFDRSNAPNGSTITENRWTEYVQEEMQKVGINVEFVAVPRWDEVTKMQTMVASQTAPDLTLTYTYAYAEDYYNQGGTWDLSEFIDGEGQAENLKTYIGADVLDIGRNTDGELYGVVAKRAITAKSNLFIRKDWLDELGLEVPETPDELYDVLEQMVKNNPDGREDIMGIVWNAWNLKMAFSANAANILELDIAGTDGALQDYYDEGMRDYYRFMNRLYNNGLLNQEYYTMSEDTFKSYVVTGACAFLEYNVNGNVDVLRGSLLKTLQENDPTADFVSIEPLKNVYDGQQYSAGYAAGGLIAFCPKTADAETVEACVTYLDWMCTEAGGFTIYHGFEGEHFEYDENNVPIVIDSDYNSEDKDWIRTDLFITGNQGYFATEEDFISCAAAEVPGYEEYVIENYTNALVGTVNHESTYTSPSESDLITDIDLIKDEYVVQCITCLEDDFDNTFDEYLAELENAGIQTIIDERIAYYSAE
ncbi:MAG: extracellular solute-binding protein [Clostridiales bacterium]|nr:extracellular solute-binding protein [Clostridiales bacterium]